MSIRRKLSNPVHPSDIVNPLQSTILCEYYLWVRWSNIREINGYYIYNGMKGNKLSFVHQQNNNLTIYFHTLSGDIHHNDSADNTYSFFSSHQHHPYINNFMPQSSIPENREDDHDIKLNLAIESPCSSLPSPKFSILTNQSNSNSNNSTPCSSPPQSPRNKNPRLTPKNSIDEHLYNHWVIKHDKHILYYTKYNNNTIDNEYPPSYGWTYNERNASELPKQYNLINFGAPPPGITRIPIIPEPMIVFDNDKGSDSDKNGIYPQSAFKNGYYENNAMSDLIQIQFDLPVHFIDIVFKLQPKQPLGFNIVQIDDIFQVNTISADCEPYKVGLKQGDILIALNEEEIVSVNTLEKIEDSEDGVVSMTICRRIYEHIMIIVNQCGNGKCNGKYYFRHLDEFNSPVFMQDIEQNIDYKENDKYPMIIRKAHYVTETGESLWTISNKTEDFYVGLSVDIMPPNTNWECISNTTNISPPTLIFYNGNQKIKLKTNDEKPASFSTNKAELLSSFAPPSKSYVAPMDGTASTLYRRPSWKKNQTPWDMDVIASIKEEVEQDQEWKSKYFSLYETVQDLNSSFYTYWLLFACSETEIERLRDLLSQHQNRFMIVRKELLEQKRREEDLLDKINALQSHSRQVSSISALFDDDYKLDIEELQDIHENQTQQSEQDINCKLDRIALETEINELKVQLNAKDVKIRELEIDISSWQETHSQIYDSFTSATKLYREQIEKFNEQEKYYKEQNERLAEDLDKLQKQQMASRNSFEDIEKKRYRDIEAELEYNSESSSEMSESDSDDSIGGGQHVRRSSKPWMQIKQKINKRRKKEQKNKEADMLTPTTPTHGTPITPNSTALLSPDANNKKLALKALISQEEDSSDDKLTARTDRLSGLALHKRDTDLVITPSPDDGGYDTLSQQGVPSYPVLYARKAQSVVSDAAVNVYDNSGKSPDDSISFSSKIRLLGFGDSSTSLFGNAGDDRESVLDIDAVKLMQEKASLAGKYENEYIDIKKKYEMLQSENEDIVCSKLKLLNNTSKEISRLKTIINVVLNSDNENIKGVITQMLKSM